MDTHRPATAPRLHFLDALRGIAALAVPALLVASGFAVLPAIWHGDAMEIARHALPSAVQVWLACALLILLALDALAQRRHRVTSPRVTNF